MSCYVFHGLDPLVHEEDPESPDIPGDEEFVVDVYQLVHAHGPETFPVLLGLGLQFRV